MPEQAIELELHAIAPGARLAQNMYVANGGLLLNAGELLTQSLLDKLQAAGVRRMRVLPGPEQGLQPAAATARLQHLFRRAGETNAGSELQQLISQYRSSARA